MIAYNTIIVSHRHRRCRYSLIHISFACIVMYRSSDLQSLLFRNRRLPIIAIIIVVIMINIVRWHTFFFSFSLLLSLSLSHALSRALSLSRSFALSRSRFLSLSLALSCVHLVYIMRDTTK